MFPVLERPGHGKPGVGRAVAALICVALAAGCSPPSTPTSPPSTPTSPPSSSAPAAGSTTTAPSTSPSPAATGPSACATSGLKLTLGAPSGYAGGVYQTIVFTNTSGATCTLYGYPGVSLVSAPPYTQIGLAAKRSSTVPVKQITLAPGATANAVLQVVNALNFGAATCSPTKGAFLRVYPPNQTVPVYLPDATQVCAQPVQTLFIGAVAAGSGSTS